MLDQDPADISLLDIVEAVDGPLRSSLPSADKISLRARTVLEKGLSDVAAAARERLAAVRLSQLVAPLGEVAEPSSATEHLPSTAPSSDGSGLGDVVD